MYFVKKVIKNANGRKRIEISDANTADDFERNFSDRTIWGDDNMAYNEERNIERRMFLGIASW